MKSGDDLELGSLPKGLKEDGDTPQVADFSWSQ